MNTITRRDLLQITGAVGAATALSGCTGSDGQNQGTQVAIGPATGPTTLDPHNHRETTTATILIHFYDGLVFRDNNMEIIPQLAASWKNVDPTTWEFKLREGVTFTNGEEFTAETVKYNLKRVSGQLEGAKPVPIQDQFSAIDTIEGKDKYTVRVNLKNPDPLFLEHQAGLRYIPKTFTEENGFDALNNNPVGTGPYTLKEWTRDDHLTQKANADYWDGAPPIDTLQWNPMPESSSRLAALLNGDVHLIRSVNPRSVNRVNNAGDTTVKPVRSARSAALWMNLEQTMVGRDKPLFYEQPTLRKAVNYAIDTESVIKNILGGHGFRSHGWAPSKEFVGYNANIKPYPHDPEKATQLLAEAGYKDGFTAKLLVPQGRYFKGVAAAEAIATMLGNVGIDVALNVVEFGRFAEMTQQHKMPEFMFAAWGNSTFNALDAYVPLVKSDAIFSLLPNEDRPQWVKTVDGKIKEAQNTADRKKLDTILQDLEAMMHEHAPFVFLFQYEDLYGVNKSLDWQPRSDELVYMYNANTKK